MIETDIKYGKNGFFIRNYNKIDDTVYESGILYLKINSLTEIVEYEDEYYFDIEYFDIISNNSGTISVFSNNKLNVEKHLKKLQDSRLNAICNKLGFD